MSIPAKELSEMLFEVISKQSQIILNHSLSDKPDCMTLRLERQSEYEKMLQRLQSEKRSLYERFVLGEITADAYTADKAKLDAELSRIDAVRSAFSEETARMSAMKHSSDTHRVIAESAALNNGLTRQLLELLIDKVIVFPENHVEVTWKVSDFFTAKDSV